MSSRSRPCLRLEIANSSCAQLACFRVLTRVRFEAPRSPSRCQLDSRSIFIQRLEGSASPSSNAPITAIRTCRIGRQATFSPKLVRSLAEPAFPWSRLLIPCFAIGTHKKSLQLHSLFKHHQFVYPARKASLLDPRQDGYPGRFPMAFQQVSKDHFAGDRGAACEDG